MTTRANEPSRSRWPRQKGTVIEQSGDPVPLSHSVIHSSDWNLCSEAVAECATAEATIATSQITIPGKLLSLMIVVCLDRSSIPPPRPGARSIHSLFNFSWAPFLQQAAMQGREIDAVHLLLLIEAEEDNRLGVGLGIARSWRHCAQISFVMHCIGELIEAIARCPGPNGRLRRARRASATAFVPHTIPFHGFDRNEMFHVEPPRGIVPGSTSMLAAARRRQCRPGNISLRGLKRRGLAYQRCR
jgi:hypothetical protein